MTKKFINRKRECRRQKDIEIFKILHSAYADESDEVINEKIESYERKICKAVNTREKKVETTSR